MLFVMCLVLAATPGTVIVLSAEATGPGIAPVARGGWSVVEVRIGDG